MQTAATFTVDPFTQVNTALWQALSQYEPWAVFVRPGARINGVTPGTGTLKPAAQLPGDNPEVRIVQGSNAINEYRNSAIERWRQTYTIQMSTFPVNVAQINTLKWLSICALKQLPQDLNTNGLIYDWQEGEGQDREISTRTNGQRHGQKQWVSALPLQVWVDIQRASFPDFNA